ncbi:hypothetical protein HYR54_06780 [Candidatus Acetothermia bacterium]|nr:hypothetical protein [Candidatus Acetothermia bacterium]
MSKLQKLSKLSLIVALAVLSLFIVGQASSIVFSEDFEDGVWNGNGATNLSILTDGVGSFPDNCVVSTPNGVKKGALGLYSASPCRTITSGTAIMWNAFTPPTSLTQLKIDFLHYSNIAASNVVFKLTTFWHRAVGSASTIVAFTCTGAACNTSGAFLQRSFTINKPWADVATNISVQFDITGNVGLVSGVIGGIDNLVETSLP